MPYMTRSLKAIVFAPSIGARYGAPIAPKQARGSERARRCGAAHEKIAELAGIHGARGEHRDRVNSKSCRDEGRQSSGSIKRRRRWRETCAERIGDEPQRHTHDSAREHDARKRALEALDGDEVALACERPV